MMQDQQRAIDKLICQSISHQHHGEYGLGYRCIREALSLIRENSTEITVRSRVLIEAARCAYYLSRFGESERYLEEIDNHIRHYGAGKAEFRCAAAVIRANIYRRRGDYEAALAVLNADADNSGDISPSLVVEKLFIAGSCRFYLNEIEDAEEKLDVALGLATHHADPRLRARILTMLGFLARSKGQLNRAKDCLLRATDLCRAASDAYGEAAARLNLGIVRYQSGGFVDAARSISRALAIFKRIGWRLGVCRCFLALGNVERFRRNFKSAKVLYERAVTLAKREGYSREEALSYEYSGDLHRERDDLDGAECCYRSSLRIAQDIAPDGDIVVEVHRRLGELYLCRGAYREALASLKHGYTLARKLVERIEEGLILRAMGRVLNALGEMEHGRETFKRAIQLLTCANAGFELAITHLQFAEILLGVSSEYDGAKNESITDALDVAEAWRHLIEASHLFHGMDAPYWQSRINRLLALSALRFRTEETVYLHRAHGVDSVEISFVPEFVVCDTLAGISHAMLELWKQVQFAARAPWPVLITGETGTGKELIARLIHRLSERGNRPFIALNCAAIPDHLFESEFFGYRRGCFTGASTDRRGMLEEANGGTLFLDEVGELTPLQQAKLLRVLQESKIRRLGENAEREIDVRVLSATNHDLDQKIANSSFRKDFYYRINAEHIHLPPLREHPDDIVPLVAFFLCGDGRRGTDRIRIESAALKCLQKYSWPGNVRELFSVLERVWHISGGNEITVDMLPERIVKNRFYATQPQGKQLVDGGRGEEILRKALNLCDGNKTAAAKWLGVSRGTLYKQLRRVGLHHFIRERPAL